MNKISIPNNLDEIIAEEGIWEDDSLDPIFVSIMESEYKGRDVVAYQLEFPSWENLGKINDFLDENDFELDGYDWEALIVDYVGLTNKKLAKSIHGDSEGETCVLWTETKKEFIELVDMVSEVVTGPKEFQDLIIKKKAV